MKKIKNNSDKNDNCKKPWRQLTEDEKILRNKALNFANHIRVGLLCNEVEKRLQMSFSQALSSARSAFIIENKKITINVNHPIERAVFVISNGKPYFIVINNHIEECYIHMYLEMVQSFLRSDDKSLLSLFSGHYVSDVYGNKLFLETDPQKLFEMNTNNALLLFLECLGNEEVFNYCSLDA
jgi:hypothetical protein